MSFSGLSAKNSVICTNASSQPAELQHRRLGHLAPMGGEPGISIRRRAPRSESPVDESLHAERASTSAGRFHLRIVELEARAFERVHEVHFNAIQVQKAGLVDKIGRA